MDNLRIGPVESNRRTHTGALCLFKQSGGPPVGEVRSTNIRRPSPEEYLYANLFAAAPDLLEALKSIENDCGCIPAAIWDLRNKAIAKAEGRSNG